MIDVTAIFSTSPHFQCLDCSTRFTFDFPPANPADVRARAVAPEADVPGTGPAAAGDAPAMSKRVSAVAKRKCPKCGAESPKTADECYSCHVIFEKLEGLPIDSAIRVQPSLVRRWKELLNDYGDEDLHQSFLMACRDQGALDFARLKYEHIRRMQGQDPVADRMIERIDALTAVAEIARKDANAPAAPEGTRDGTGVLARTLKRWRMFAFFTPLTISLLMILWGMSHPSARNMIGAGIAVSLLSYGAIAGMRRGFR